MLWPVVGLTLAAFALRIALARGDLWGDEAASVMMSLAPTATLLRTLATAEPHPPLFPLTLKAWMLIAGTDELPVRFISIAAGTALVPVMAALGSQATSLMVRRGRSDAASARGGELLGGLGALLAAISPFLLWYATEARMYPLATLLGAASFYWLLALLRRPAGREIVGYGLSAALALLSHYFVLYIGLAQAIVGLGALARDRRLFLPLAAAAAIALAPVALWLVAAGRIVGSYYGAQPGTVDLVGVLVRALERIPAGWSVEPATAAWVGAGGGLVALAGSWLAGRRSDQAGRAWLIWLLTPALAAIGVSLVRPMYQERYLAVIAPPYLLLVALVLARLRRPLRAALLCAVLAAAALPLANAASGSYVRSQYGSHTAEINALGRPGEAVLLTGTSQRPLYDYYAGRGGAGLPVFGQPVDPPAREEIVGPELAALAERFDALWVLLYAVHDYDPNDVVERWLTRNAYRAPPRWTINGRLARFETERGARLGPAAGPRPIAPGWRVAASLPSQPIAAGALLPLRLDFERDTTVVDQPKLRLRLVDDAGFLWGEADEVLGSGFGLPREGRWTERRAVPVLAGAGPGNVRIEAQLYVEEPRGIRALGTLDLGTVALAPSDRFWSGQIAGFHEDGAAFGSWGLIGWAGAESRPAGERAYLTTVLRAGSAAPPTAQALRLVGPDGRVASTRGATLAKAAPGTVRRLQFAPPIGSGWPAGVYRYELQVGGARPHRLGALRVTPGARLPAPSPPTKPLDATFGGAIRLRGYTAVAQPPAITLQWEALREVDKDLSVFVHLLDAAGQIAAQSDGPPAGGRAPTDAWRRGDVVDDRRELAVPPGDYRLLVGLYDPRTGARLSAQGPRGEALGDAVEIGRLRFGR